ncbi:MAG: hypothetical protein ACRETU_12295 [Steroidobacterales bacterium]
MKVSRIFPAVGALAFLAGCATMPDQTQQASYASPGCKIVLVDSASQEIRAYNSDLHSGQYRPNTPTEQAYAVGQIGKQQALNPRFRMGHNEPNNIAQAHNDC